MFWVTTVRLLEEIVLEAETVSQRHPASLAIQEELEALRTLKTGTPDPGKTELDIALRGLKKIHGIAKTLVELS